MKKIITTFVLLVAFITSCDLWEADLIEFLEYYTYTAAIDHHKYDGDYPSYEGSTLLTSESDKTVFYIMRNPQRFTLNFEVQWKEDILGADGRASPELNKDYVLKQDPYNTLQITFKEEFLRTLDEHPNNDTLSATIHVQEPDSQRIFESYTYSLAVNNPPLKADSAILSQNEAINRWVLAFSLPQQDDLRNRDITRVKINGLECKISIDTKGNVSILSNQTGLALEKNTYVQGESFVFTTTENLDTSPQYTIELIDNKNLSSGAITVTKDGVTGITEYYVASYGSDSAFGSSNSPYASVQHAIDRIQNVNDGSAYTIYVMDEVTKDSSSPSKNALGEIVSETPVDITIKGVSSQKQGTLNASGSKRVLYVSGKGANVTLAENLTLTGGKADNGAGLYIHSDARVNISGVEITNNTATTNGGGVFVANGGTLNVIGSSTIQENTAKGNTNNVAYTNSTTNSGVVIANNLSGGKIGLTPSSTGPGAVLAQAQSTSFTYSSSIFVLDNNPTNIIPVTHSITNNLIVPMSAIYVSQTGSGDKDGSSADNAIAGFNTAQKLASDGGTIWVVGALKHSSGSATWGGKSVTLSRYHGYTGALIELSGGNLTLENITLDGTGQNAEGVPTTAEAPLVSVSNAALTLANGATLQNNNSSGVNVQNGTVTIGRANETSVVKVINNTKNALASDIVFSGNTVDASPIKLAGTIDASSEIGLHSTNETLGYITAEADANTAFETTSFTTTKHGTIEIANNLVAFNPLTTVYWHDTGSDDNVGNNRDRPVKTLAVAASRRASSGKIYLTKTIDGTNKTFGDTATKYTVYRHSSYKGALFSVASGTLTLQNITLDGNQGAVTATAPLVAITGGTLNLEEGTELRYNNNDGNSGGAVGASGSAIVNLNGVTVQSNNAHNGGGVDAKDSVQVNSTKSTFSNNTAFHGAAICAYNESTGKQTINITDGNIRNNTANHGAVFARGAVLNLNNAKIADNNLASSGAKSVGGIYEGNISVAGDVQVNRNGGGNVRFDNNAHPIEIKSSLAGSNIGLNPINTAVGATLAESGAQNNFAENNFTTVGCSPFKSYANLLAYNPLSNVYIGGNGNDNNLGNDPSKPITFTTAKTRVASGGKIWIVSTINGNNKTYSGGTLYRHNNFKGTLFTLSSGTLNLSSITIDGGNVSASGSIIEVSGGTLNLGSGSVLQNNITSGNGGGIYTSAGTINISDASIKNNISNAHGGGICVFGSTTINVSSSSIISNTAKYGGGVFIRQGSITLNSGADISSNTGSVEAGGIYAAGDHNHLPRGVVTMNSGCQITYNKGKGIVGGYIKLYGGYMEGHGNDEPNGIDAAEQIDIKGSPNIDDRVRTGSHVKIVGTLTGSNRVQPYTGDVGDQVAVISGRGDLTYDERDFFNDNQNGKPIKRQAGNGGFKVFA